VKDSTFRHIVTAVLLLGAVVVVHDIWANRSSERAIRFWTETEYKQQANKPFHLRRSLDEIKSENKETHKPKTWLF
jgi:hypothetical protein